MDTEKAEQFATEWIKAWNDHDLKSILSHYSETVEFISPLIAQLAGEPSGRLTGKKVLRDYFAQALTAYPDLHFKFLGVFAGVTSLVLHYVSVKGLTAAEVMEFDSHGKIHRVLAHYQP